MKLKRIKNVSWREVDGEGVVLHFKTGAYYSLNEVGLKIWELCDGKKSVQDIQSAVTSQYKGERGRVERDVDRFVRQLYKEKLIERIADRT